MHVGARPAVGVVALGAGRAGPSGPRGCRSSAAGSPRGGGATRRWSGSTPRSAAGGARGAGPRGAGGSRCPSRRGSRRWARRASRCPPCRGALVLAAVGRHRGEVEVAPAATSRPARRPCPPPRGATRRGDARGRPARRRRLPRPSRSRAAAVGQAGEGHHVVGGARARRVVEVPQQPHPLELGQAAGQLVAAEVVELPGVLADDGVDLVEDQHHCTGDHGAVRSSLLRHRSR